MSLNMSLKGVVKAISLPLRRVLPETAHVRLLGYISSMHKFLEMRLYPLKKILYAVRGDGDGGRMVSEIVRVMPYTMVGIGGLEATFRLAERMIKNSLPGNFIELGVARGGCAALMASVVFREKDGKRTLWLFDSFEGLPDPTEADYVPGKGNITGDHIRPLPKGSCLGTEEEVRRLFFEEFKFPKERVRFVKGWFQDTLPVHGKGVGDIAVLRIDGDWYESTKCCLDHLYGQVVKGGAVIIDDYQSCHGCRKAVDEFLSGNGLAGVHLEYDGRGGAYFLKP